MDSVPSPNHSSVPFREVLTEHSSLGRAPSLSSAEFMVWQRKQTPKLISTGQEGSVTTGTIPQAVRAQAGSVVPWSLPGRAKELIPEKAGGSLVRELVGSAAEQQRCRFRETGAGCEVGRAG